MLPDMTPIQSTPEDQRARYAKPLEAIKSSALKMEAEETNPRLKRCLGKIAAKLQSDDDYEKDCDTFNRTGRSPSH